MLFCQLHHVAFDWLKSHTPFHGPKSLLYGHLIAKDPSFLPADNDQTGHSGTVSLDKDKYLIPAPNLQRTRASHDLQYTRYFAYSDALKNSFFPRTIPLWNSLPSSVVSSKTIEEFKGLI